MRIDYKNPIVKMCCRCLSIRDLKKVLKLPSCDSMVKVLKDWESGALISLMMPVFMIENSKFGLGHTQLCTQVS